MVELQKIVDHCNGIRYSGGFMCMCPCHDDKKRSLSVTLSDSKRVVAHCYAGCDYKNIIEHFKSHNLMPESTPHVRKTKNTLIDTYYYEDLVDNKWEVIFEKLRYLTPDDEKTFIYRKRFSNRWVYKDVVKQLKIVPLYNLQEVLKPENQTIYIVEGEKDVKTLIAHGLTATTNHDGACKWKDHYNPWLNGKDVVVIGDNDLKGKENSQQICSSLAFSGLVKSLKNVSLDMLANKEDVTDYLDRYTINDLKWIIKQTQEFEIVEPQEEPEPIVVDLGVATKVVDSLDDTVKPDDTDESSESEEPKKKKKKIRNARYKDYVALYKETLGKIEVDIFSEALVYWHSRKNYWEFARPALEIVRSDAAELQEDHIMKFSRPLFNDHMAKLQDSIKPKLLIDIPKWDGVDHIKRMADCLNPSTDQGFSKKVFEELIKDWIIKSYKRIYDPNVRNRILILKGKQNKGKDWWIDSLLFGADQFLKDMHLINADKDAFLQLSEAWFLKIGEFDKSARTEVSVLKDMITKPYTDLRAPYDAGKKRRYSRCSFISASNINDILRDSSGSTRYIILELDDLNPINFDYPVRNKEFGLQILSQARFLAEKGGVTCSAESESELSNYLDERTPSDPYEDTPQIYIEKLQEYITTLDIQEIQAIRRSGRLTFVQIQPFLADLSKMLDIRMWTIQNILNSKKLAQKIGGTKYYIVPKIGEFPEIDGSGEPEESGYTDEIPF